MSTTFNHVASRKALPEPRRHDRTPDKRKPHLASMRVTGERQCDALRHEREDVGVMRQQDQGCAIILDGGQCGLEIVSSGPEIADACDPQRACGGIESRGRVLDDANAAAFECGHHAIVVKPAIMVPEDRNHPSRRAEPLQLRCDRFRSDETSTDDPLDNEVAEDANQIGLRRVRAIDRVAEFPDSVERGPNVKISQDGDS
jgi:hypothetical protein